MKFIFNNWVSIVGLAIIAIVAIVKGKQYLAKDKEQKIAAIREWLKYGVTVTEKAMGSGTGALKLRMLYSMLTSQFPYTTKILSFEEFSKMVDEALLWMKNQLESNANVLKLIEGGENNVLDKSKQ